MTHNSRENKAMPLEDVKSGQRVRVVRIDSGCGLAHRLAAMGLFKDEVISVVRNDGAEQIIVEVKNSRVILGRGMSHKVLVEPIGF